MCPWTMDHGSVRGPSPLVGEGECAAIPALWQALSAGAFTHTSVATAACTPMFFSLVITSTPMLITTNLGRITKTFDLRGSAVSGVHFYCAAVTVRMLTGIMACGGS